jgi:excinuclease ABC subunit A
LYVLDEPSIGLHSRDTHRLIKILHDLRDLGNTILVVEHDPDIMRAADRILDLGPGAGRMAGKSSARAPTTRSSRCRTRSPGVTWPMNFTFRFRRNAASPGRTNSHHRRARAQPEAHRSGNSAQHAGGDYRRLRFGKSSLLHDVLYQALAIAKRQTSGSAAAKLWDDIEGDDYLDEVVLVDQSPIGRTPRSNPVTYIKAFDIIRELFASLPEAKKRGFPAGHFSFNVPGGRCENCQGDGTVTVEMQFLADVELICDECKGTRYKPQVLEIHYKGKNIHEVLNLTIREALKFFADVPRLTEKLRVLDEVGLGYLRLGQSATTLSGGEAQRMKLAAHLQPGTRPGEPPCGNGGDPKRKRRMLYIFDEPTTGLHFDDVSKLLSAFRRLIDAGGSIVVIEHNLEVIKTADWVIDLGPEGGDRGGNLVGSGPPEAIAELKTLTLDSI